MNSIDHFFVWINGYLWGPPMLVLLLGTHVFFTFRLRIIQRHLPRALKLSFSRESAGLGDVTPFGSLATALSTTIGAGSLIGVAAALTLGGPGALLWMWVVGLLAMSTKYAEALLSVKYRRKNRKGVLLGGPMLVLENGMGQKWLAVVFCALTIVAAFCMGNMVQANSIAGLIEDHFKIDTWVSGACLAIFTAVVIIGGIRSIAQVCTKLVPFMAVFYVLGCLIILMLNGRFLLPALALIVKSAFSPHAAGGGFAGASLLIAARYGAVRGMYPNDAGLGSTPIAAAAAQTEDPVRQALISSTGTFWDSVVICALTGLVLVTGILKHPAGMHGLDAASLMETVFSQIPVIGHSILTISMFAFVFTTILGWTYYSERAFEYLFRRKSIAVFRYFWIIAIFFGALLKPPDESSLSRFMLDFSNTALALMAIPNLIAILFLNREIVAETKKYLWDRRSGDAAVGAPPAREARPAPSA